MLPHGVINLSFSFGLFLLFFHTNCELVIYFSFCRDYIYRSMWLGYSAICSLSNMPCVGLIS